MHAIRSILLAALLASGGVSHASEAAGAPALLDGGRLASTATRASSPDRWGLTAADFALLESAALIRKADVERHRQALLAAAGAGDAYAQFLLASHPGEPDDAPMMQRAVRQGLVRAVTDANIDAAMNPGAAGEAAREQLKRMAETGSAHAKFMLALAFAELASRSGQPLSPSDAGLAFSALNEAVELGYAPAQFVYGRQLLGASQVYDRARGRGFIRKAAAQGFAEAQAMVAEWPKP